MIQMIHNGGVVFGSYLKPDTLDTWSEGFFTMDPKRVNTATDNLK